jgi:hypothetical protein|tara:strand:- start:88 stop:351 length:264 start_codon:yes stop_codon:yes gene_type:complete
MNQKLYMQVIIQAIRDSASSDEKKVYKAFDWFGSVDFEEICLQANLNPQHLRESLLKLINSKDRKKISEDIISAINGMAWQREVINH